jgi:hypothetical protein
LRPDKGFVREPGGGGKNIGQKDNMEIAGVVE